MKEMLRRIVRLESECAHSSTSADAQAQAEAHAELTMIFIAVAAEKAAGDVHGIAGRLLADVLAEVAHQA